jgi:signal transduction histidine kinase
VSPSGAEMEFFRRYLTSANYLSWPVVGVSAAFLLSGHLLDTPLNGTENIPQRAALLIANQAAFFLVVWGCDRLVVRRIPESYRWFVVLATIATLAAGWAVVFTWQLWQLGLAPTFDFAPRIRGWLMSLSVMTVLVAMAYGLVAESARLQRRQADIAERIERLQSLGEKRRDADSAVIAKIRSQLEETLALEKTDSAEATLRSLRAAIDDIIRPVTQMLTAQGPAPGVVQMTTRPPISWRTIGRRFADFTGVAIVPGALLFAVSSFPSVSTVMGVGRAFVVLCLIFLQLIITTFLLTWLGRFLPRRMQAAAFILALIVSATIGAFVFWPVVPWGGPLGYFLAFIIRYALLGVIAVVMAIAFDENRRTAEFVARNQADVDWALARAHEVDRYHNQVLATLLHGKWQAVLAAAAARLQIALREGASAPEAVAIARADTGQLSLQDLSVEEAPRSIQVAVSETISLWEGVAEIAWDPQPGVVELVDSDPVCSRLCGELILELCTNAIKHAGASEIDVSLSKVDHRVVRVVVRNNGEPYHSDQPGYGSRLLEHSCIRWSVSQEEQETVVSADVPWSAH